MKKLLLILIGIGVLVTIGLTAYDNQRLVYMPLIFDAGVYYDTPTPKPPTPTNTPRPPTPTPTATPTYIRAEGGNTCVVALGSRYSKTGDGIKFSGQVPGLCSKLEVQRFEYVSGGRLVVVKAYRIKTDTYGCRPSDFAEGIPWPPVEDSCPPVLPLYDEIGRPLWGDYESFETELDAKIACGYDDTNPPTDTFNCLFTVD